MHYLQKSLLLLSLFFLGPASMAKATEIGFLEDFVLSQDRKVALDQLIPGSEEYYYFHCLHHQNRGQFNEVAPLLREWTRQHGKTSGVIEIQHRQALLTYDRDPQNSLDYLRQHLSLRFDHQRDVVQRAAELPTALDPKLLSRERLLQQAFEQHPDKLDGCEDSLLEWLAGRQLHPARRRELLQRLQRPDVPGLVALIADDLTAAKNPGFGAFPIHQQLLKEQLDRLLRLQPSLRNEVKFIQIYLRKLAPNPDVDWREDSEQRRAYLEQLWSFASTLAPAHNSLKAHVLYHRLLLDRCAGHL